MASLTVKRAEYAGACYGVQRALDMTVQAASTGDPVCTLGPLIHNPRVVADLQAQGIFAVASPKDVESGSVVIRSHGVVPEVIDALDKRGLTVVDATCPYVMRAQRAAAKLARDGYHVLVVGEDGHPEVEGISAHALATGGVCTIVGGAEDIPASLGEKVGIVVQTTQSREKLDEVVGALRARSIEPLVKDTICFATTQRQEAAVRLAKDVPVMIIIGGRNSSNTTRLYELCQQQCAAVYHIEGVEEIDPAWFEDVSVVGISAGASTPEEHILAVVSYLQSLHEK